MRYRRDNRSHRTLHAARPSAPTRMLALFSALAALLVAGCGGSGGSEGDPRLTIYMSAPLSGPASADGRDATDGARLAFQEADGEVAGVAVEAEYLDVAGRNEGPSDPVSAGRNARTAIEDSTSIAYIGELDSPGSRTSIPITNSAGLLQVAPGSGASDLVVTAPFDDSVPMDVQGTGERTFARILPSDEDVADRLGQELVSGPVDPGELPPAADRFLARFEDEYGRAAGPWAAYGFEAMASVLAAVERAEDPLSREAVVTAYFDGTERESVLGSYVITDEGETTLESPIAGYEVGPDGQARPAGP